MKSRDVMTKNPVYCVAGDTVNSAAQLMIQKNVGAIPVVDHPQSKKLVGIVTDRDLALRVVGENRNPLTTRLDDVMTRNLVTCYPDDDLNLVMDAMSQHQIRRVPVIDTQGRIVGIIAQADIALRTEDEHKTAEVIEEISKPALQPMG
jgi:CBS domain-containing protein